MIATHRVIKACIEKYKWVVAVNIALINISFSVYLTNSAPNIFGSADKVSDWRASSDMIPIPRQRWTLPTSNTRLGSNSRAI
jgi:hypothetical protein